MRRLTWVIPMAWVFTETALAPCPAQTPSRDTEATPLGTVQDGARAPHQTKHPEGPFLHLSGGGRKALGNDRLTATDSLASCQRVGASDRAGGFARLCRCQHLYLLSNSARIAERSIIELLYCRKEFFFERLDPRFGLTNFLCEFFAASVGLPHQLRFFAQCFPSGYCL